MKLYKLKKEDVAIIQTALTAFHRHASISYAYADKSAYTDLRPLADMEFDTAKLGAILEDAEVFMSKPSEKILSHRADTGFDLDTDDFEEIIDSNTSNKPLSLEAKEKLRSLWWKSQNEYLLSVRREENGLYEDLNEEQVKSVQKHLHKEALLWNEIISLARAPKDNTNE